MFLSSSREGSRVGVDTDPVCEFSDHCAAVKAVGWSPHQHGTLASGGGTADRYCSSTRAMSYHPLLIWFAGELTSIVMVIFSV